MKEKSKEIVGGVLLIVMGILGFLMSDKYWFVLFGAIKVDFRIVGGICIAIGLLGLILALLPGKKKAAAPRQSRQKTQVRDVVDTYIPEAFEQQPQAPLVDVRAMVMEAKAAGTPEAFRQTIQTLEGIQEAQPGNRDVVSGMLACYDGLLRSKGDRSFGDYQQRFYAALRAIYLEEQNGRNPTTRRFWAIHSAVHGGIAAASAKDLDQLEDSCFMLERASQLCSEGNRELDQLYMQVAIPSVQCWTAYWIARITATEKPDFKRSAEALALAETLCPVQGVRVCDMNPHLTTNTKVMLTRENLAALRKHLQKKAGV